MASAVQEPSGETGALSREGMGKIARNFSAGVSLWASPGVNFAGGGRMAARSGVAAPRTKGETGVGQMGRVLLGRVDGGRWEWGLAKKPRVKRRIQLNS